jgi:H/ACA ribonucleoprotein complex non-core subunit NAF1
MELGKSGPTGIKDVDVEDDEEENGANTPITGYLSTKNEIVEANITIPDITQVSPEEELERVGKIISVMGSTAIVEGLESRSTGRGLDRALDSETLLVFEDRQVFGYVSRIYLSMETSP